MRATATSSLYDTDFLQLAQQVGSMRLTPDSRVLPALLVERRSAVTIDHLAGMGTHSLLTAGVYVPHGWLAGLEVLPL